MKFSDVFWEFYETGTGVSIGMSHSNAKSCTTAQLVKFSRMKFEKILRIAKTRGESEEFYPELGTLTCPLCAKFFTEKHCNGCPIKTKTGRNKCANTPYAELVDAYFVREWVPALEHEIAFLKELEAEL